MEQPRGQLNAYVCACCHTYFDQQDEYKSHYKSDYHKYNLKRKLIQLPPVTQDQFNKCISLASNNISLFLPEPDSGKLPAVMPVHRPYELFALV